MQNGNNKENFIIPVKLFLFTLCSLWQRSVDIVSGLVTLLTSDNMSGVVKNTNL